jgi:ribosome-associated translation inhibitor RaiA
MHTTITARHCDVPETLRERAETILHRLEHLVRNPLGSWVTFDRDGEQPVAEVRLHVSHGEHFVAKADGVDHRTALDRAEGKLRRQVEKVFGRPRARRVPRQLPA